MKVLVLGWEYPPAVAGGLGAACHGLTTALADRGHEVVLCTPADGTPSDTEPYPGIVRVPLGSDAGFSPFHPGALLDPYAVDPAPERAPAAPAPETEADPPAESSASSHARSARKLYGADLSAAIQRYSREAVTALAGHDFDVIHAHDWMTFPAALRLRFARRRPVCLHVHSTVIDRGGRSAPGPVGSISAVERAGLRTADRVCAVSGYTRDLLVREYRLDPGRVSVVHNAAPEGVMSPADRPRDPAGPTVLFVGRLTRQKGVGFLIRAAARVLESSPDARFVVMGEGEDRTRMIEMAAALGIGRRVFFAGGVSSALRDRAYREASVFVLSSVSEPFGLTPLEALRGGAAPVLSDACGVREVLPSAPVSPPWDAAGLAAQIVALLTDEEQRLGVVAKCRSELERLTWAESAQTLEAALEQARSTSGRRISG
ncbi:MAG: glycosyltransferase family 4 protein [Planctomycetes bacterium]|nr:glycosyltransferase family 4 protein [Planctomycetota bacterium]